MWLSAVRTSMRFGKSSDMVFLNDLKLPEKRQDSIFDCRSNTLSSHYSLSGHHTRGTSALRYKASSKRGSPVYSAGGIALKKGGVSVTSVPCIPLCA